MTLVARHRFESVVVLLLLALGLGVVECGNGPSGVTFVKEGNKFTLTCKVPLAGLHMWYKDGKLVSPNVFNNYHLAQELVSGNDREKELLEFYILMKLSVERADTFHSGEYKCSSVSPFSQRIIVINDNMIKTNEAEAGKGLILLPGKQLVLQCETTVCVNCTVEWLKDGEHLNKSDERIRIHDANNSLIISKARVSDTGDYMCFVNKSVIGEFVNATIVVRPKTQVEQFDKSINLVQGNKLNLHCNVKVGIPVPTISWYKDGQLLNGSDDRIGFSEDDKGIPNAILTIDELEYTDRANYMCEADNGISSSNATTLVRVKDKLAALWPFLGICAEVIILCTIIFIYEKKKVKEVNNPDVDQIAESRNVPERGRSQEIRQRK
ncbi:basigin-like isoform X4 [Centruroides vittatus]|uniref:basigin-like isoform X4 n=1 Tax=Centruroides vittatus TaxID=120091 RepID=UPI003510AD79